ncbi:MFS transporter [Paenibacillus azoreducens]|uniref:MFS transporter n=1 Tax=Paenibacillus azoreducens TaxID=116718 RepID=UPI0039F5655E
MEKIRKKIKSFVKPMSAGWKGASIGLAAVTVCLCIVQAYYMLGSHGAVDMMVGAVLYIAAGVLICGIVALAAHFLKKVPSRYMGLCAGSALCLLFCFIVPPQVAGMVIGVIILLFSILGCLIYKWAKGGYKDVSKAKKVTAMVTAAATVTGLSAGVFWLASDSGFNASAVNLQELAPAEKFRAGLQDPAAEGKFKVKTLVYGSPGNYRSSFNQSGSLVTKTVDGSAFVENWSATRTSTLGFGPDAMPLNGLVWYPDGEGPFPLVIAVHGNHLMTEYSDPGYEYLGRLLASRGYIFVSIDENFLNTSPFDDLLILNVLKNENPARGLLMLEHLKTWEAWSKQAGGPFRGKVDMNNIALIGHSRGAEAIAIAAAYNRLNAYPEDGNIKFDYHFNIGSLIAIGGTDQQYKPAGQPIRLRDMNYLAVHGAHDMDVDSFAASNQYQRIDFTQGDDRFKAAVYIYGANHGQFNSVWGRKDTVGPGNKVYNTKQLMSEAEQQQAAKVLISSFLDATLKKKNEYQRIFQDIGYARKWLPETIYVTNYLDSQTTLISSFDDDTDPESTTIPGGKLKGQHLLEWKEEKIKQKHALADISAVRLGWDRTKKQGSPSYTVTLPPQGIKAEANSSIVFSLADAEDSRKKQEPVTRIDLTVKVADKKGNEASLPLSSVAPLLPMIEGEIIKAPISSAIPTKEPVFQSYGFRLNEFRRVNPNFEPEQLAAIVFEFNRTEKGAVLLNDIGIRN